MKTILVTWSQDTGYGHLEAQCDDDHTLSSNTVRWEHPINSGSDSWAIADAITEINGARVVAVDHDRDVVLVHVA